MIRGKIKIISEKINYKNITKVLYISAYTIEVERKTAGLSQVEKKKKPT